LKVLLLKNVAKLGLAGQVKSVKDGYGKNFLIAKKLAVVATDEVVSNFNNAQALLLEEEELKKIGSSKLKVEIEQSNFVLSHPVGPNGKLIGSVTSKDILLLLSDNGIYLEKHQIRLFDKINKPGVFSIDCKLDFGIHASLQITVSK
jgi:large subunit ribosomal protein L9